MSAHLLIPGFTFTGMTAGSNVAKLAGAWTAEQVIDFMLASMANGDFYILSPTTTCRGNWTSGGSFGRRRHCREPAAALPLRAVAGLGQFEGLSPGFPASWTRLADMQRAARPRRTIA